MQDKATVFPNQVAGESSSTLGEKLSDTVAQVKDKVSDLGRTASHKIDENRDTAATGIKNAATALHENADKLPGGENVNALAHAAAEKLNTTANYVRAHHVNQMMADLRQLVKNNPGPALLGAAAIGFMVGRSVVNKD